MKRFWIKFNGMSMFPLLKNEDHILIESVGADDLNCGDIVLFLDQHSRELTLHRLIDFPIQTKGDFSLCLDSNSQETIIGRALGFERGDYYRVFPKNSSIMNRSYLCLSKLRMKGKMIRKLALVMLFLLTKVFELYSDKTKLNYNKEQLLTDPSSRVL